MSEEATYPFSTGPFVRTAALCEKVLQEADGVFSFIRLVDTLTQTTIGPNAPAEMPELRQPLTLIIMLTSGAAHGSYDVTITPELPSGEILQPMTVGVQMEGGSRSAAVTVQIDIPFKMAGLYWFRVEFDHQVITRVPLDVRYTRVTAG